MFWDLSSSSANNNLERHVSIKTLQNKVAESQHVFDAMKNELLKTQNMNIQKRNSYTRRKKNVIRKREMDSQSHNPNSGHTETATKMNNKDVEKQYIAKFGNEKTHSTGWTRIALWESADMLQPKMIELCEKASKAAGRNDSACYAELDQIGTLRFINTNFPPISSIYVVCCIPEYGDELDSHGELSTEDDSQNYVDSNNNTHIIFDYQNSDEPQHQHNYTQAHHNHNHPHHDHEPHHGHTQNHNITQTDDDTAKVWYVTRGTRDDCVFFLDRYYDEEEDPVDSEYILTKEVCGLEHISNTLDW